MNRLQKTWHCAEKICFDIRVKKYYNKAVEISINNSYNKNKIKASAFFISAISLFLVFPLIKGDITRDSIISFVGSRPAMAPLAYLAALAFLPLIGVPRLVLASIGGALFGMYFGTLYAVAGSTLAAIFAYHLAFYSAAGYVEESAGREGKLFSALGFSRVNNFRLIVLARICPVINCELVNYICGAAKIPFRSFISATVLGTIPGSVVYVMLGDSLMRISARSGFAGAIYDIVRSADMAAVLSDADMRSFFAAAAILIFFMLSTTLGFYIVIKKSRRHDVIDGREI